MASYQGSYWWNWSPQEVASFLNDRGHAWDSNSIQGIFSFDVNGYAFKDICERGALKELGFSNQLVCSAVYGAFKTRMQQDEWWSSSILCGKGRGARIRFF